MLKHRRFLMILLLLVLVLSLGTTGAKAWKLRGGSISRGNFTDNGVSFQVPPSFSLVDTHTGPDWDEVLFEGPSDVNGFIPHIRVFLYSKPINLDHRYVNFDLDYATYNLNGSKAISAAFDPFWKVQGQEARRSITFYNQADDRMGILYRYHFNLDGVGVVVEYVAKTATRSLPDDLQAIPRLLESIRII